MRVAARSLLPHHPARRAPRLPAYLRQQRRLEASILAGPSSSTWRRETVRALTEDMELAPYGLQAAGAVNPELFQSEAKTVATAAGPQTVEPGQPGLLLTGSLQDWGACSSRRLPPGLMVTQLVSFWHSHKAL